MDNFNPGPPRAKTVPPTVYCYICGRQFGSHSIDIHQPQCLKKWRDANDKLPKSKRRPEPKKPEVVKVGKILLMKIYRINDLSGGLIDYEATNAAMYEASLAQLVKCEFCGRKFAPDRLHIHHQSCTKEHPAAAVGSLKVHRDVHLATTLAKEEREEKRGKTRDGMADGVKPRSQSHGRAENGRSRSGGQWKD